MANQKAVAPAQSAVASATADMFNGRLIADAQASIRDIGFGSQKAEADIVARKADLEVFDKNLLAWICVAGDDGKLAIDPDTKKYVPIDYQSFMQVREWYAGAAFDAGCETLEAAAKVWERAINRLITVGFVRPTSKNRDAVRMSEKAAKLKAELAAKSDAELESKQAALIESGDTKSLREALAIGKELERRAQPEIDKAKAEAKQYADVLTARVKELAKAATPDALEILIRMIQASK